MLLFWNGLSLSLTYETCYLNKPDLTKQNFFMYVNCYQRIRFTCSPHLVMLAVIFCMNHDASFKASASRTGVRWGVALRCKGMCTESTGTRLTCCHAGLFPQVLWHWWVICHAAAVILSVYDRCQIKFIFLLKASSQLLNRPLLSAVPRCSLVCGAMSSLITLSNKPKEVEGGCRIISVYSHLMATWQPARCFFIRFANSCPD